MRQTVRFHGSLAEQFGGEFVLAVESVSEAVRALCMQIRGLREQIRAGFFGVAVNGKSIGESELPLSLPENKNSIIEIIPIPSGSGGNSAGIAKTAIGVLMVIAGIVLAVGSYGTLSPLGVPLIVNGVVMIGAGVASFFMPTADTDLGKFEKQDKRPSFLFNGATNTSTQGAALPLVYGRRRVGSVVISAGIETSAVV